MIKKKLEEWKKQREIEQAVKELNKLSDLQLKDIGLHRGMIREVVSQNL